MFTIKGKEKVLKDLARHLLAELIKNSRRSDRELARAIGSSQPTTTRLRCKLEKEGYYENIHYPALQQNRLFHNGIKLEI